MNYKQNIGGIKFMNTKRPMILMIYLIFLNIKFNKIVKNKLTANNIEL